MKRGLAVIDLPLRLEGHREILVQECRILRRDGNISAQGYYLPGARPDEAFPGHTGEGFDQAIGIRRHPGNTGNQPRIAGAETFRVDSFGRE